MSILGVDIGTTSMKMGVFTPDAEGGLEQIRSFSREYPINVYNNGTFGDIEQSRWQEAFREGCRAMGELAAEVDAIALSGTTPGLSAIGSDGKALYPAILMLDQRSRSQAADIIRTAGLKAILDATANMPVAGGCSLASILWLKENEPEAYAATACFGHSNTFIARWLTGKFAIDPSSASLSALYNTSANDLTWNGDIAAAFGIETARLPDVIPSHQSTGRVEAELARELGLTRRPEVIIGGNDAVLAAFDAGVREPGEVINVNGTCEISLVCLPQAYPSTAYNIRAHVLPDRWLTLYVMNAGGKAFEWFQQLFCSEMSPDQFWDEFIPRALEEWLERESNVEYVPYLMGSRYSLEPLRAGFTGMNQEVRREELLAAMVRGLYAYQREHLKEISLQVPLKDPIYVTGGAVNDMLIRAKQRWMRKCDYAFREQSSLRGAALLARKYLDGVS